MKYPSFQAAQIVSCLLFLSAPVEGQSSSILRKESKSLGKVSSELVKLARFCVKNKVYTEARAELRKALIIAAEDAKPVKELEKLEGKIDNPSKYSMPNISKEQAKAYEKCAKIMSDYARECDKKGYPEPFEKRHVD